MPAAYSESVFRERFWARVAQRDGCWNWQGATNNKGYGMLRRFNRPLLTHRVAYELVHGPIPAGAIVRHTCDNPPCCNPAHLLTGTIADNSQDMVKRGRATFKDVHWTRLHPERKSYGEATSGAKLTEADVLAIRARYAAGGITQRELSAEYGVGDAQISRVITGQRWPHL